MLINIAMRFRLMTSSDVSPSIESEYLCMYNIFMEKISVVTDDLRIFIFINYI